MLTWSWIIQITIISIILIFLVHHLIHFFKTMLTVPKIKDLVNTPNEKYKNIYETISHNNFREYENDINKSLGSSKINYTLEDILPPNTNTSAIIDRVNNSSNMKNELKNFIKKQLVN
jgi:hypothetical protein